METAVTGLQKAPPWMYGVPLASSSERPRGLGIWSTQVAGPSSVMLLAPGSQGARRLSCHPSGDVGGQVKYPLVKESLMALLFQGVVARGPPCRGKSGEV